jgi:phosphoglycerate dehydrogenase-like enzyme/glyoxylase-like metal-dependent hydrolase (beta-lactamase superfamily II)
MHRRFLPTLAIVGLFGNLGTLAAQEIPKMKFNEVREVAPGVFFRYSSISASDPKIPFGGCNNIWIVFDDYVVAYDANFPKEAEDVFTAIKKTTTKPVRYVLDSHHHGDHAFGNAIFAKYGATVIAQANCARILRIDGPKEFQAAGRGATGRKDIRESFLKVPDLIFDDKLVLDDGKRRAELYFLGHAHTPGDAVLYLPKEKLLCTGDACVNGAYNFMGHSDSASWIRVLDKMKQLDVQLVCPGHGPLAGPELFDKQQRFFVELRKQVKKGIDANQDFADIHRNLDMPWYKEWTGVSPTKDNARHVFDEFTGRVAPWDLKEDFGIYAGQSPTKKTAGWTKPRRILVPSGLMPARLRELKLIAPEVEFIPVRDEAEAVKSVADADAVLGFCNAELVKAGKKLRWIQVATAGVEKLLEPTLAQSQIVLTNTQRIHGPNVADQAFALLLCLSRDLAKSLGVTQNGKSLGQTAEAMQKWESLRSEAKPQELHGKTMLVVGLGGIGQQIARRGHAFGMRVMAIDPQPMERPGFVFSIDPPAKLLERLPQADVVVLACPLTKETRGLMGTAQFEAMKPTAYFINVARGGLVQTPALVEALQAKRLAGAGLDVSDPEPLPGDNPLWKCSNVVISPHIGGKSPEALDRQWRLYRENVRRFVAGEPLLCVVDKQRGY